MTASVTRLPAPRIPATPPDTATAIARSLVAQDPGIAARIHAALGLALSLDAGVAKILEPTP